MDCGPAALKSLLEGFGIPVGYGRLREACQTDLDGTSIDAVEVVAREAGLDAEQVMVPVDHVLTPSAQTLPAIAVVRTAAGSTHFAVIWRAHGHLVQMMDPAHGRIWLSAKAALGQLIQHTHSVPAAAWHAWARSEDFLNPLAERLRACGVPRVSTATLVTEAREADGWLPLATLDAATRMVTALVRAGALPRAQAESTLRALLSANQSTPTPEIPERYWSVRPGADVDTVRFRGAVLVRARQRLTAASASTTGNQVASPEIAAALAERPVRPLREIARLLLANGVALPAITAIALTLAVVGVIFEASLLRSVVDVATVLRGPEQGWWAGLALTSFAAMLLAFELLLAQGERRLGNHLEARLRIAFLDKVPRLPAAYFQSRPMADMLERSHSLHTIRVLPRLAVRFSRVGLELAVTAVALVWLNPSMAILGITVALSATMVPLLGQLVIRERDLKVRTHAGALARYQLDALRGRTAIESHGASRTIEREHDGLLGEWTAASLSLQRASLTIEALQMTLGFGLVAWYVLGNLSADIGPGLLLQIYWLLNLPTLGYELALIAREYPAHRSTMIRLMEPLGAPDSRTSDSSSTLPAAGSPVSIDLREVVVSVAGQNILETVNLRVGPAAHVAVVGASGAGKSSLVGLLLGWYRPASGEVLIDGVPLDARTLDRLRARTAWVDPTIQVWNASMLENLLFGTGAGADTLGQELETTGLTSVVASLPEGLATPLGESGTLLSSGEAQRVRFTRALLKKDPQLVLLDEPFLGLERERRRALLTRARQRWAGITLLYVTHDIAETRSFDRVVIVERGRIVEEGDPRQLVATSSRYRRLLQNQESVQSRLGGSEWRRLRLEAGRIVSDHARSNEQSA